MAVGIDKSKIESLVIFNEISAIYPIGADIECRFYIDSDLVSAEDKIGLFRVGWSDKGEFIVLKEIKNSQTDEFGEKKLIFPGNELPKDTSDQQYQFCYFHLFNDVFHLCGNSPAFRFVMPKNVNSLLSEYNDDPTVPELSFYPTLDSNREFNQTIPKRRYDATPNDTSKNLVNGHHNESQINVKSIEYQLANKEGELAELKQRFGQQDKVKELQIESLTNALKLAEKKFAILENELKLKNENDNRIEIMQNDLMDTIKLVEAKNCSLEEQLLMRDKDLIVMKKKCSEQEEIIDELKAKLAITQNDLDSYRTAKSKENGEHDTENRFLRDKVEELKLKYEKAKNIKEALLKEKIELEKDKMKSEVELKLLKENMQELKRTVDKAEESKLKVAAELRAKEILMKKHIDDMRSSYKSSNDVIIQARHTNSNITIYVNEMKQEMKDYAISYSSKALKSFNDIKSIAESIVSAFNDKYGKSWHSIIGENIAHNACCHVFGTYISFSIEDLKIIIFKTNQMLGYYEVLESARNTKKLDITFKNEYVDSAFEALIVSLALESIDEDFNNYAELSGYLTKVLNEHHSAKYGSNWLVVAGASDHFDSNFRMSSRRYVELQVEDLKLIILQIDEKTRTQPRLGKFRSLKV